MASAIRELGAAGIEKALSFSRALRPSQRDVERIARDGMRFRTMAEAWPESRKTEWTLDRLRFVVRRAARETPFWRDRLRAAGFEAEADFSFDDYARLEPLDRDEAVAGRDHMISRSVPGALLREDSTGGSTGVPFHYHTGPEERGWRLSGQTWVLRKLGIPPGAHTAFLWGHHVDRNERSSARSRILDRFLARSWYDCFRLSPSVLRDFHRQLSREKPRCLIAYASALESLSRVLREDGVVASYPTGRIITGAEKLWADQRALIESVFSVPVHERYGSRDVGLIGTQLDPRRSLQFTVDWANLLVEPETGESQSSILVTKLHADAMPMLRYRIGDMGAFAGSARSGHPSFVLDEVVGREADRLFLPDGRWLHGIGIRHTMKDFPVREFQARQDQDYSVVLLVVPASGFSSATEAEITRIIGGNLAGVSLKVTCVDSIPRTTSGKTRPVISAIEPVREVTAL
ncbi:MAG: hypothetical protein ACT4OZ_02280 [Gemmatimonadota bacterium]